MGAFVTGNTPLPPLKRDAAPPVNPEIESDAADFNNLWAAAGDLRTSLLTTQGSVSTLQTNMTAAQANIAALQAIPPPGRTFATDANDVLQYTLDEQTDVGPWANTGSAGAANLVLVNGGLATTGLKSRPGLFSASGGVPGRGIDINTNGFEGVRAGGASLIEPAVPISVSFWLYYRNMPTLGTTVCKAYRPDGTWTDPWATINFNAQKSASTANLLLRFSVSTGGAGSNTEIAAPERDSCWQATWNLVVGTYDGTTMKLYVNGVLVASGAKSGALNYGTHGPWMIGQPIATGATFDGRIDEIRVANVLRSQSWVESYWRAGMLFT